MTEYFAYLKFTLGVIVSILVALMYVRFSRRIRALTAQHRLVETVLEQRNIELDTIIDSLPQVVCLYDARDMSLARINKAGIDLLGLPRERMPKPNDVDPFTQRRVDSLVEDNWKLLHNPGMTDVAEVVIDTPHGQRIMRTHKVAIRKADGSPRYLACISEDITELKHMEQKLEHIFDASASGMLVVDAAGKFILANKQIERIFGYTRDELLGRTVEFLVPEHRRMAHATWRHGITPDIVPRPMGMGLDIYGKHKSGREIPLQIGLSRIDTAEGMQILAVVMDISEQKRAEQALQGLARDLERRIAARTRELEESHAHLRALVAQLAKAEELERRRLSLELHDYLAQTLTLIRLTLSRAITQHHNTDWKNLLTEVQQGVDDAIRYTRNLMTELSPQILYDLGLPTALTWFAEQQGKRHGLEIDVRGEPEDLPLDEERLVLAFQCVRELLWNIVKHAQASKVTVAYAVSADELLLEVSDNGQGFDPERLFGRRPKDEVTRGFGLFSIRERLALLGGRLEIHSAPNEGARVCIFLPLGPGEDKERPSAALPTIPTMVSHSCMPQESVLRVVLVDDHEVVRQGLRRVLEHYADLVVVGEAVDGMAAITMARTEKPDLVLMDINLPIMSGIEATRRIKDEFPDTIIIGLSFATDALAIQAFKSAGAYTCVAKERAVEEIYQTIMDAYGRE